MIKTEETAVSPVIGTVLILALVVILVGIFSAFAMGYSIEDAKSVGLQVISEYHDAIVTLLAGSDVSGLEQLDVSVAGGNTVAINESGVRVIGLPILFKNVAGYGNGSKLTTVTGVFSDHVTKVLWVGTLNYETPPTATNNSTVTTNSSLPSEPFTIATVTGSYLRISFPSDWNVTDVYNPAAGVGNQIIVQFVDSSGQVKLTRTTGNDISSIAALVYSVKNGKPYSESTAGLAAGEYTVNIYSQKIDLSNLYVSSFPTLGGMELQTRAKIEIS